jgi:hypothetical protein
MVTPNPFVQSFAIQYYEPPQNLEYINVYNQVGQLVWQKRLSYQRPGNYDTPNYIEVNLGNLNSGIYHVQIVYRSKATDTFRVIKINN